MYTAIVLDDNCRVELVDKLMEVYPEVMSDGYAFHKLPHHCTINMGPLNESLAPRSLIENKIELTIDGFSCSHDLGVVAARVSLIGQQIRSKNDQAHITMCLQEGSKPYLSNKLEWDKGKIWYPVEPFIVTGCLKECL